MSQPQYNCYVVCFLIQIECSIESALFLHYEKGLFWFNSARLIDIAASVLTYKIMFIEILVAFSAIKEVNGETVHFRGFNALGELTD